MTPSPAALRAAKALKTKWFVGDIEGPEDNAMFIAADEADLAAIIEREYGQPVAALVKAADKFVGNYLLPLNGEKPHLDAAYRECCAALSNLNAPA